MHYLYYLKRAHAMPPVLDAESTLTDRYQTTVPESVRRALGLSKGDKIRYAIQASGEVVLSRAVGSDEDEVLTHFLAFLADDMARHPERLHSVDAGLVDRLQRLTKDVEVDLDVPLPKKAPKQAPKQALKTALKQVADKK